MFGCRQDGVRASETERLLQSHGRWSPPVTAILLVANDSCGGYLPLERFVRGEAAPWTNRQARKNGARRLT